MHHESAVKVACALERGFRAYREMLKRDKTFKYLGCLLTFEDKGIQAALQRSKLQDLIQWHETLTRIASSHQIPELRIHGFAPDLIIVVCDRD